MPGKAETMKTVPIKALELIHSRQGSKGSGIQPELSTGRREATCGFLVCNMAGGSLCLGGGSRS